MLWNSVDANFLIGSSYKKLLDTCAARDRETIRGISMFFVVFDDVCLFVCLLCFVFILFQRSVHAIGQVLGDLSLRTNYLFCLKKLSSGDQA